MACPFRGGALLGSAGGAQAGSAHPWPDRRTKNTKGMGGRAENASVCWMFGRRAGGGGGCGESR